MPLTQCLAYECLAAECVAFRSAGFAPEPVFQAINAVSTFDEARLRVVCGSGFLVTRQPTNVCLKVTFVLGKAKFGRISVSAGAISPRPDACMKRVHVNCGAMAPSSFLANEWIRSATYVSSYSLVELWRVIVSA